MLRIEFHPSALSFDQFHVVDAECFPEEPIDRAGFAGVLAADFWAAFEDDSFVGFGYVVRRPDLAWLSRIGVATAHRNKQIATRLLEWIVDHCQRIGLPDILLYVQSDNRTAIHLYERFGFTVTETAYQYVLKDPLASPAADPAAVIRAVPIVELPRSAWPSLPPEWATIGQLHDPPEQYVFVFHNPAGETLGYCRLSPQFPGCFPFVVEKPSENLAGVLRSLRPYPLPDKLILKLTFSADELAEACSALGLSLNYRLLKMMRSRRSAPHDRQ